MIKSMQLRPARDLVIPHSLRDALRLFELGHHARRDSMTPRKLDVHALCE